MEDQEIIALFFRRDPAALEAVQRQYGARLEALARRLLGSPQDGEECVSDTLLKAWDSIPPNRPQYLSAYLLKICRNNALEKLQKQQAQKRSGETVSLTAELESCLPAAGDGNLLAEQQLTESLNHFLASLPKQQRQMFLRRYWYADSVAEIALRFRCSQGSVKTALHRMRKKLKQQLMEEGYDL